ncbi:MAG: hypothetical protein QM582_17590 [Micropruina sp.]|uniref:hypothetical protein n=1 Tax=Micropruina sp. TaxID=2737536 RepID=UPI0039E5ED13
MIHRKRPSAWILCVGLGALVAATIWFAFRSQSSIPTELSVKVTDGGINYLSNPGKFGDAIRHNGVFEVLSDRCLYVRIQDQSDEDGRLYLAAIGATSTVNEHSVQRGDLKYLLGQLAAFEKSELVGTVPASYFDTCTLSNEVYALELAT